MRDRCLRFGGLLEGLPVVVEEVGLGDEVPPCDPREAAQVATAVTARRIEYAAGRHCARRALARLGVHDFVLLNGADRCPVWPAGVIGSITHTGRAPHGYGAAAVARTEGVIALGIDAEPAEPLEPRLWEMIATPAELRALVRAGAAAGWHAKLLFTAKESFYKAQFPLTRRMLDFHDVEVELDVDGGRFTAGATSDVTGSRCAGRFGVDGSYVLAAAVGLTAAATPGWQFLEPEGE